MRKHILKKSLIIGIILLFTCSSFASSINEYPEAITIENNDFIDFYEPQKNVVVSCNNYGLPIKSSTEIEMTYAEAKELYEKINKLAEEIAYNPSSDVIDKLQEEILFDTKTDNLLPKEFSLKSLQPRFFNQLEMKQLKKGTSPINGNRGTASFCNFATTGSGMQFPIIILPRLIPILLTPIPRAFLHWSANEGFTTCGSYLTGTGFIAGGMQRGTALGFWGVGFSVFLPPVMAYGFIGYALLATCTAEEIEPWPPNNPPLISDEKPSSGEWNIPITQSELSFRIEDPDGDKMSYSVTTDPDIGSGNGSNKKNGLYSVPISGLKSFKKYTWTVEVSDGIDTTKKESSFITADVLPDPFDPFVEGWQYRKQISINSEMVVGNLNDFPILVHVTDPDLRDKAQSDGDDILFMLDSGVSNILYHEIEKYDSSKGELIAWVKIPNLDDNIDTVLYMYYGNPSCDNQQYPERVWDSNYIMVQHMHEYDEMIYDSTINDNDGTIHEATSTTGAIGQALHFDGDDDYVDCQPNEVFDMDFPVTLEAWIYKEPGGGNPDDTLNGIIMTDRPTGFYSGYKLSVSGREGDLYGFSASFGNGKGGGGLAYRRSLVSSAVIEPYSYYQLTGVIKGPDNINLFLDGQEVEGTYSGNANTLGYKGGPCVIGNQWRYDYNFHGIIDEVHISNTERSSDWISTGYNNQNDPTSFLSFGSEETGP